MSAFDAIRGLFVAAGRLLFSFAASKLSFAGNKLWFGGSKQNKKASGSKEKATFGSKCRYIILYNREGRQPLKAERATKCTKTDCTATGGIAIQDERKPAANTLKQQWGAERSSPDGSKKIRPATKSLQGGISLKNNVAGRKAD